MSVSGTLPFKVFVWGGLAIFVGSESGQIQSVKLNRTPYPALYTYIQYCILIHTGKRVGGGGRVEPERRLERQQFTKLGREYQHDCMCLQSINSEKR